MSLSIWRTLKEVAVESGAPEASVSARLRDLRKARFGSYLLEMRPRGERAKGLVEYRLLAPDGRTIPEYVRAPRHTSDVICLAEAHPEVPPVEERDGERWVEILTMFGPRKGLITMETGSERHVESGSTIWIQKREGLVWQTVRGTPKTLFDSVV